MLPALSTVVSRPGALLARCSKSRISSGGQLSNIALSCRPDSRLLLIPWGSGYPYRPVYVFLFYAAYCVDACARVLKVYVAGNDELKLFAKI